MGFISGLKDLVRSLASLMVHMVKNLPAMQETWVQCLGWEDHWEKGMTTQSSILFFFFSNPVFLPGEFHGQRSLAGYSLWGLKELDMTEQLTLSFSCFKVYNPVVFHIFAKFCCSIKVGHKKTAMS